MIRRRVKEGAFNDVQQKVEAKPTTAAAEGNNFYNHVVAAVADYTVVFYASKIKYLSSST
jgi:hypothetical protein